MIFWLFVVAVVVQCGYALWFAVARRGKEYLPDAIDAEPVSVIICAKNEGANLRKNLPAVLDQWCGAADGYEVIVVNDASTDDTAEVLAELARVHEHLRVVTVGINEGRTLKGKKHALSKGVAAATHEWLLLTDADCAPAGGEWLMRMTAPLLYNGEIVLGYGGYNKALGLLNAFIRWETMHTWLQYSSYAYAGVPYMGVGRNMACTKSALLQAQADPRWNVLPSGDDDMLVQLVGTANNVEVVADSAAHTHSDAKASWREWARQKQRHLSTGKYYKRSTKLLLSTYAITHGQVWGAGALMCMAQWGLPTLGLGHVAYNCSGWVLPLLTFRCLLAWYVWAGAAVRLGQKSLIPWLPLMDIGWLLYNFAFLPWITWKNKRQWT